MRTLHSFVHRSSWGSSVIHVGLLIITLLLTGCAIGHTKVDLSTIEAPPPEKARIFVIRPNYHFGGLIDLKVAANNNEIAALYNLSYTSFLVPLGSLTISGDGTAGAWPHRTITIDVTGGQTYYIAWIVETSALSSLFATVQWVSLPNETAQQLLNNTNYIEPKIENLQ